MLGNRVRRLLRYSVPHSIQCTFDLVAMAFHRVINTHQLHWKTARLLLDLLFAVDDIGVDWVVLERWLVNVCTMNTVIRMMGLIVLPMLVV